MKLALKKPISMVIAVALVLSLAVPALAEEVVDNEQSAPGQGVTEDVTPSPEISQSPEITEAPEETEKPELTEPPEETEKPELTEPPEETEKPELTEPPEETEKPEITEPPEETEKPEFTEPPLDEEQVDIPADPEAMVTRTALARLLRDDFVLSAAEMEDELTNQEVVAALLLWAGMDEATMGAYPQNYNSMADSMGLAADIADYDPEALCTNEDLMAMKATATILYDALGAEHKEPLIMNGKAQPIFEHSDSHENNGDTGTVRYIVYVETNHDTDGDGALDLVKTLVQIPRDAINADGTFATIFEARPYITGCIDHPKLIGDSPYDIASMYAQPAPRAPADTFATTAQAVGSTDKEEWYYLDPYESIGGGNYGTMNYENLNWYDYFLIRGFAVVATGGLGTKGSDGFETCGTDLEIDAFKCVIEWLAGDRVAYTDKEHNIPIKANWSNGNVGMTGRSYSGTTQFGLANTGIDALKTIVPVAGIASWYDYTKSQGVNVGGMAYSDYLAWYCNGRYIDQTDYATIAQDYGNYLWQIREEQLDLNGDYGKHWVVRDYTTDASNIKCPALIVHGLNDDNVRTKQFDMMYRSYQEAGAPAKLLLHQGAHVTPTAKSGGAMYIGDELYDDMLNKWFTHYLYEVENGVEEMANVMVQSNSDATQWTEYDSWETAHNLVLNAKTDAATTTLSSDYAAIGVTSGNWQSNFSTRSSASNALYQIEVDKDIVIKGVPAVSFRAAVSNAPAAPAPKGTGPLDAIQMPNGENTVDHDNMANPENLIPLLDGGANHSTFDVRAGDLPLNERDGLMVTALLVDLGPEGETFPSFKTNSSATVAVAGASAWEGPGLSNTEVKQFKPVQATYKVIAKGWADLCNPTAGYDSASADIKNKVALEEGEYHNYTLYLQPNVYTVEAGHRLAVVLCPQDPGKVRYSQNYIITLDNSATTAVIPVADAGSAGERDTHYVVSDPVALSVSAGVGGKVSASHKNPTVSSGSEVTLTATANPRYRFTNWTINGEHVGTTADTTYTITVTEETTVVANFEYIGGGSGGGSGGTVDSTVTENSEYGEVKLSSKNPTKGESVTVIADPIEGYALERIIVTDRNGKEIPCEQINGVWTFVHPGNKVTVKAVFVGIPSEEETWTNPFTDVADTIWYYDAVQFVTERGMMNGTATDAFDADATTTRGMIVTILHRLVGSPAAEGDGFTDVAQDQYYADAVSWAATNNIVSGYGDGAFGPDDTITRQQMVLILYRVASHSGLDVSGRADLAGYADAESVDSYAADAMSWALSLGLINGTNETTLSPNGGTTRGQVATILMRFCETYKL